MKRSVQSLLGAFAASSLLLAPLAAQARAHIIINNQNGPGEGFNDPTPVAPVGGNPGTTIGEQRQIAFEFAASMWGATLDSPQTIIIDAKFSALSCTATEAVLGSAAPEGEVNDDPTFPMQNVWYPYALANAFANRDVDPGNGDIVANFNENLGQSNCLPGVGWYYGLDGKPSGQQTDLPTVLLHEFSHGLGFLTYADQSGSNPQGIGDVFEKYAYDQQIGKLWYDMTDSERAQSTLDDKQVVWTGSNVVNRVPGILTQFPLNVVITAPVGHTGSFDFSGADFGPKVTKSDTGTVAYVQDANGGSLHDACGSVTGVSGKWALVDRLPKSSSYSPCTFKTKAANVQAAGAVGMIVEDYPNDGSPPGGMADDTNVTTTITIPSIFVSNDTGTAFQNALAAGTTTIAFADAPARAGADANNEPYLYTPTSYQPGSSVSHWSLYPSLATPSLLMEPYIHPDIPLGLDLTPYYMADIGWTVGPEVTLAVAKAGSDDAWPGGTAQYIATVLNHGTTDATNVVLNATTPTGLTLKSVEGAGCTTLPCTLGTVAADSRATVIVTYDIPLGYTTPDPVVEDLSFTSGGNSSVDNHVTFSSAVTQAADLIATANAPSTLQGGDAQPVPVTITNNGPSVAEGVTVTTSLASANVQVTGFSGDCSGATCSLGTLQPGDTKHINVLVKASGDKTESFKVSVGATTSDPYASNNDALVKFTVTSGGCTAPGEGGILPLLGLAGLLMFWRRRARA